MSCFPPVQLAVRHLHLSSCPTINEILQLLRECDTDFEPWTKDGIAMHRLPISSWCYQFYCKPQASSCALDQTCKKHRSPVFYNANGVMLHVTSNQRTCSWLGRLHDPIPSFTASGCLWLASATKLYSFLSFWFTHLVSMQNVSNMFFSSFQTFELESNSSLCSQQSHMNSLWAVAVSICSPPISF